MRLFSYLIFITALFTGCQRELNFSGAPTLAIISTTPISDITTTTAISGGNIAILAGLTLAMFRFAGVLGRAAMLTSVSVIQHPDAD